MAKVMDNSKAIAEQEELLEAISENNVCLSLTAAQPLGATLLAFNQIARTFGRKELTPQEWGELAIDVGLKAIKRSWKYTADTQNLKEYAEEMRAIAKLFTVPAPDHDKYLVRMQARYEAEQNCRAKYGIQ